MAVCHLKNFIEILFILLNNISVLYSLSEIIQIIQIICKLLQIIGGGFSWCSCGKREGLQEDVVGG